MLANGVLAEHLRFGESVHSVADAARAVGGDASEIVKSICLVAPDGALVVAIVKGEDQVSRSRVGRALGQEGVRLATAEEILRRTGYPAGGTPPFGYPAVALLDPRVLERPVVYAGGGSDRALLRISTAELLRASGAKLVPVRR